jgi:hypothetical protein
MHWPLQVFAVYCCHHRACPGHDVEGFLCFAHRIDRGKGNTMKKLTVAGLAATGLLVTSTVASAQALCVLPIMVSAIITSANEHRELTQKEAMWCVLYHDPQAPKAVKKTKKKAKAR